MPKFKNPAVTKQKRKKREENQYLRDKYAFRSVLLSAIIGSLLLVISYFLNGTSWFEKGIFVLNFVEKELIWEIVDKAIKVAVIVLSFCFFTISIGNYKELTGKPVEVKELVLLVILAILQSIRDPWVLGFTIISLVVLIFYFYIIQER